jgi:hypothetical protein
LSKITVREIKEKYLTSKEREKRFKWTYYVRRPASYYMAWPFLRLGVSANAVTLLWIFIAVIGCGFLASGGYLNMLIGAILIELAVILDCVDGHIARFTRPRYSGEVLDTWAGEMVLVLSMLSIGIGMTNSSDIATSGILQALGLDNKSFIYVGVFSALASISSWTVRVHWRTITMRMSSRTSEPDERIRNSKVIMIVDNLFHYSGALTALMVIASVFYVIDVLLLLIASVYGLFFITIIYRTIRKAYELDSAAEGNGNS